MLIERECTNCRQFLRVSFLFSVNVPLRRMNDQEVIPPQVIRGGFLFIIQL